MECSNFEAMKEKDFYESAYKEMGGLAPMLRWIDSHPVLTNIIIAVECIAFMAAVLFYDFTTNV